MREERYARLVEHTVEEVFAHLGWPWPTEDISRIVLIHKTLKEAGLARGVLAAGGYVHGLSPTYGGVVRVTQAEPNQVRRIVEGLIPDWETTTVEFKREVPLNNPEQKVEFVKDLCALATTKASGAERFLVVGFDARTRRFVRSVDPKLVLLTHWWMS